MPAGFVLVPAELVSATILALQENASRLGLVWIRRLATVADGTDPTAVMALFDGDTVGDPIAMTSMIGPVGNGQRVYVDIVPPGANFIVGLVNTTTMPYAARKLLTTSATSITMPVPANVTTLDVHWTLRSDEGPGVAAAGSFIIDGNSAAGYISRTWSLSGASGTAGTHAQAFGTTSATFGIYPTGAATSGRFGGGSIHFPAWNDPHSGSINWTFQSGEENALSAGFFVDGEGIFTQAGPYESITLLPGAAGSFVAGSQVTVIGQYAPLI